MSKHVYHDGRGEVHIYSALKGCDCEWCKGQRYAQRQGSASARKFRQEVNEDGAQMLLTFAGQIAARKRISLSVALREARERFPAVAAKAYSADSGSPSADVDRGPEEAGAQLHDLALARQREASVPYAQALADVIRENPSLGELYAGISASTQFRTKRKK